MGKLIPHSILLAALSMIGAVVAAPSVFATEVCELKIKEDKTMRVRVGDSLHIETYNTDPNLSDLWMSLFGVDPEMSMDDLLTLQRTTIVTWAAGRLSMGGEMKLRVKTDKKDPSLKEIKIEKAGKNDGTTVYISGSRGVNPNVADGGWHEVKIKNMDGVEVTFYDGEMVEVVTGFLKELKVKLDRDSLTFDPIVRDFKLTLKAETTIPDIKKGLVYSVTVDVPKTVVTTLAGTEYEEKVKDKPEALFGHTEAEFEREDGATTEGVDITSLVDGNNDLLTERVGPCVSPPPDYPPYEPLMDQVSFLGPLYATGATEVPVAALEDAETMLAVMLRHRRDVVETLQDAGALTAVFGRDQTVCDLPYFSDLSGQPICEDATGGLGGVPGRPATACSEKNVLKQADDPFGRGTRDDGENVCVHELAHTIMNVGLTDTERVAIQERFEAALSEGLWVGDFALVHVDEFFAEMSQTYFCANPEIRTFLHTHGINCAAELQAHDPLTFDLIDGIYRRPADLR